MSETSTALSAHDLRKSFPLPSGRLEVLRGLDFSIRPGVSASIRGESGSGKSTLLHLFAGLEKPDRGGISWNERSIGNWSSRQIARERNRLIGMVFQNYHLMAEMTALENILFAGRIAGRPGREARARAAELLDQVGLGDRARQLPAKMSGGERQRVAIARALLNRPGVLLADEPTGNLDERTGERVMEMLLELVRRENVALVLVTHNPGFAAACSETWQLHSGVLESA